MSEPATPKQQPKIVFETAEMTPSEIEAMNKQYASMGIAAVVIDVSRYMAKHELQSDGSMKRSLIRRRKVSHETGSNRKQPAGQ